MAAGLDVRGRDCPLPARHAAAQPSMIEDRRMAAREFPERVIEGENGVICS
jgi:hypothetical protein